MYFFFSRTEELKFTLQILKSALSYVNSFAKYRASKSKKAVHCIPPTHHKLHAQFSFVTKSNSLNYTFMVSKAKLQVSFYLYSSEHINEK